MFQMLGNALARRIPRFDEESSPGGTSGGGGGGGLESWRLAGAREEGARARASDLPVRNGGDVTVATRDAESASVALSRLEVFARDSVEQLGVRRGELGAQLSGPLEAVEFRSEHVKVARCLGALRDLTLVEQRCAGESFGEMEAVERQTRREGVEARSALRECTEALARCRGAVARSAGVVSRCRRSVERSEEKLAAARRNHDSAMRQSSELDLFSDGGDEQQDIRRLRMHAEERRALERLADCEKKLAAERRELQCGADSAILEIAENEACEEAAGLALRSLADDFCAPRCLAALRATASAHRARLDAANVELTKLEVALEQGSVPPSIPQRERQVSRALELLRDATQQREARAAGRDTGLTHDTAKYNADQAARKANVDAHVAAFFATTSSSSNEVGAALETSERRIRPSSSDGAGKTNSWLFDAILAPEELPTAASGTTPRTARHDEELVARVTTSSSPASIQDHASAIIDFIDDSALSRVEQQASRASAVARALNRQRSRATQVPTLAHLGALAKATTRILDACLAAKDVRTPVLLIMLAQTFFFLLTEEHSDDEDYETVESDVRRERAQRTYLKDALKPHATWRQDAFWERAMAAAAADAVAATTREDPPYLAVVATPLATAQAAAKIHQCVHAQLAALCLARREFGGADEDVRRFARKICTQYQLPDDDLATLLFAYSGGDNLNNDDDDDESEDDD